MIAIHINTINFGLHAVKLVIKNRNLIFKCFKNNIFVKVFQKTFFLDNFYIFAPFITNV